MCCISTDCQRLLLLSGCHHADSKHTANDFLFLIHLSLGFNSYVRTFVSGRCEVGSVESCRCFFHFLFIPSIKHLNTWDSSSTTTPTADERRSRLNNFKVHDWKTESHGVLLHLSPVFFILSHLFLCLASCERFHCSSRLQQHTVRSSVSMLSRPIADQRSVITRRWAFTSFSSLCLKIRG